MQRAEAIRVLAFVGTIALIYVGSAGVLIRRLRRRVARLPNEPLARRERVLLWLAAAGLPCLAYGLMVEPYWLEVTRVRLRTTELAGARRPIRIVHVSDLHSDPRPRLEERLPEVVAAERPDLIVFTGDCVNSPGALPVFRRCLSRLASLAPTYVVKGNWDAWYWSALDVFGGTGAVELNGAVGPVAVAGTELWLAGVPVYGERRIPQVLGALPAGAFTVFLYHYPDEIEVVAARGIDLYCAGHTHGGQVALPFYGALMTLSRFGKRYEWGLYRVDRTWLYVNRGIGMEGGAATPRVRFCARPEVTVLEIVPEVPAS